MNAEKISPQKILVIYDNRLPPEQTRITIIEHVHTMDYSEVPHDIVYYNTHEIPPPIFGYHYDPIPISKTLLEENWDAVILHYSFLSFRIIGETADLWEEQFDWINQLSGIKIAIPQDEGNYSGLLDEWLYGWDVSIIFSVHYKSDGPLYPIMRNHAAIYPCLPGYIDMKKAKNILEKLLPIAKRTKDIIYRVRKLPYWFGRAGYKKSYLAEVVSEKANVSGLIVDIKSGHKESFYGNDWLEFIASGKTVLAAQGGYSMINYYGEIPTRAEYIIRQKPEISFNNFSKKMPYGWDDFELFTITPRHFDAAIVKTCQVLLEGEYKNVLKPNRHYILIKEDYSNLDDVLRKIKDLDYIKVIADRTYEDIVQGGRFSYKTFAEEIENAIMIKQKNIKGRMDIEMEDHTDKIKSLERELLAGRKQNSTNLHKILDLLTNNPQTAISNELIYFNNFVRKYLIWMKLFFLIEVCILALVMIICVIALAILL